MSSRPRKRRRNNPNEGLLEAEQLAEGFHGRPAKEQFDIDETIHYDKDLAQLGLLCEFEILTDSEDSTVSPIAFQYRKNPIRLCGTKDRKQIILVGGNQNLSNCFSALGIPKDYLHKRAVVLGHIHSISYFSDKWHLEGGKEQEKGVEYQHEFGEQGGTLPQLIYYPKDERMEISGGSYTIRDEGIYN